MSSSRLFEPMSLGQARLGHRVVMAPLTRYRCDDDWVPLPMAKEYYTQRACEPGTLLITEATLISRSAVSRHNVPGIFSEAQVAAWRDIVEAVHAQGCLIYCQLWHLGRAGWPSVHADLGTAMKSSSAVRIDETRAVPAEMTEGDIREAVRDYAAAARNAVAGAGFDGVEIHGANGYLVDQFLQDTCNRRTDAWGGSVEGRARFALEVVGAVVEAVGADRTALRLSPFSDYLGMLMADPYPTFEYLVGRLKPIGLAYLHLIEARISGNDDADCGAGHSVDFLVRMWDNQSPILLAGGFTPESARKAVDDTWRNFDIGIVFGRHFISNPDLVFRVKEEIPLCEYDRSSFYTPKLARGYIDYPFSTRYADRSQT
ncbi:NADH:flavin oxidoreductase/NADH oxidase [Xylariaceae sp. FL0804]|nr:NADH:flavin oxidoreductase/NADH oxidase [Xylariaceae sp. FL0804]